MRSWYREDRISCSPSATWNLVGMVPAGLQNKRYTMLFQWVGGSTTYRLQSLRATRERKDPGPGSHRSQGCDSDRGRCSNALLRRVSFPTFLPVKWEGWRCKVIPREWKWKQQRWGNGTFRLVPGRFLYQSLFSEEYDRNLSRVCKEKKLGKKEKGFPVLLQTTCGRTSWNTLRPALQSALKFPKII